MIYIGVDPGANGAAVAITHAGQVEEVLRFKNATEADVACWFGDYDWRSGANLFVLLEQVHSMPKQGVASSFKFGRSYGFLRGVVVSHSIPFETVTPAKWQGALRCRTGGDKNVTKAKAQELFPHRKWTHADADAVLIAEFCRRTHER